MKTTDLTDSQIGTLIDHKVSLATAWNSKLTTERTRILEYIDGKRPRVTQEGRATFTSRHCYNAVEMMRAQLGDTFSAGSGIVTFDAFRADDAKQAEIATAYTNHVFYTQNNGERIIRDAVFDGLTARVAIGKVWWEPKTEEVERKFSNLSSFELEAWKQFDPIKSIEVEEEHDDGTASGKIVLEVDLGQVKVSVVNPLEFFIEDQATELSDEWFCGQRMPKTIDWIVTNFPEMKGREDELASGESNELSTAPETLARFSDTSNTWRLNNEEVQDELREVIVVEAYCRFKRKDDLTARLYKVLRCGSVTIDISPVDRLPFVAFVPLPRPHEFFGENFVNTVIPIQNAQTVLTRSILDAAVMAVTPRYTVVNGGLVNPNEIKDPRYGGIVNLKNSGVVDMLPAPQINPMVMTLMSGLDQMNEATTGITALSQGLNKDAVSKANSAAQLEQQTGVSQTRQKEIARQFSNGFLVPIFTAIYNLVLLHEKRREIEFVSGQQFMTASPTEWREGRTATASAHLGYGEKDAQAAKLMMLAKEIAGNEFASKFVGPEGAYNILSDILTLQGHRNNIGRYLPITPDMIPAPEPSPMELAEVAKLQAEAQARMIEATATAKKVDEHGIIADLKAKLSAATNANAAEMKRRAEDRKDAETATRIAATQTETDLLVKAANEQTDPARPIISP